MNGASLRPTSLGDLRITSLQAGGIAGAPPIVAPPFTIGTGGGVSLWILATNFWRDIGVWDDAETWKD